MSLSQKTSMVTMTKILSLNSVGTKLLPKKKNLPKSFNFDLIVINILKIKHITNIHVTWRFEALNQGD